MIYSLFLIPVLGAIKNYVKYKKVCPLLFIRTPTLYILFYFYFTLFNFNNRISLTIIYERVFMFVYKIILSLIKDDYNKKKRKYIKKYGLDYAN